MGLDAVEIVMDVEDHFGISIQYSESERIRTVGELASLIQSRIEAAQLATCPTLASFLRLRSCVREIVADEQLRVRTGTRIVDVLTGSQRKRLWSWLGEFLGSPPSPLRRPPMLRRLLLCLVVAAVALALLSAAAVDWAILPATLALAAILAIVLQLLTMPFRVCPPDGLTTLGDLSQKMAGVTVATKQLHLRSVDEILDELRPIVVETLGVDPSEVVLTARFVEDLGMG